MAQPAHEWTAHPAEWERKEPDDVIVLHGGHQGRGHQGELTRES